MAGGGGGADGEVGFQIAPMIDLILVLMVFFMTTVALKQVENELGITLPGTSGPGSSKASQDVEVNIGIDPDGTVNMNSSPIGAPEDADLGQLKAKLEEQIQLFNDKIPVIISPQPDVLHKRVIQVLNACSAAKVKNISFGG